MLCCNSVLMNRDADTKCMVIGWGKKIHDDYMGFRDAIVPWFRVAEGSYDNYLGIALANQKKG